MYLLLKMVVFHCYVSLVEGKCFLNVVQVDLCFQTSVVQPLGFQTPCDEEVFGPKKPTQKTFSAGIWKAREYGDTHQMKQTTSIHS